jgi:hypothetical protein
LSEIEKRKRDLELLSDQKAFGAIIVENSELKQKI